MANFPPFSCPGLYQDAYAFPDCESLSAMVHPGWRDEDAVFSPTVPGTDVAYWSYLSEFTVHGNIHGAVGGHVLAGSTAKEVSITFLEDERAKCMDGSPAAYYLAANTSSTSWVIHLEGGGECASKTNCDARKGSALSSSKYFAASVKMNFLNQDTSYNPVLRQFNRVFLPYCSQDLWSGQRTEATNETFGYYFSGHLIVEAVLDELAKNHGLEHATEIVVSGVSPLPRL